MAEYKPVVGDRVRCIAEDGGVQIDEVGRVYTVLAEPCMVLAADNGKVYLVALAAANLERLG